MTKEQEAIEYLKESILIYKNTIPKISESIETVLSMLKEKDSEIERLEQTLTRNIARNVTASMKESAKSKEDLEMLNKGWQIELEKKDKQIDLMAKWIFDKDYKENSLLIHRDDYYSNCIKQVKQYFEKQAKEKGE